MGGFRDRLGYRLASQFSAHRWRQFGIVVAFTLVGALAELASIGAVLPFLQLIAMPQNIATLPGAVQAMAWIGTTDPRDLLLPAALLLIVTALMSALVRMLLVWASMRFAFGLAHDLSMAVFERVIQQPYALFVRRNSAEIIASMDKVNFVVTYFINPLITAISSGFIALGIVVMLVLINPLAALAAGASIVLLYALIGLATKPVLVRLGREQAAFATRRVKLAQEAVGGVRDIILDRSHDIFSWQYRVADARQRRVTATMTSIATAPRYVVEGFSIILVAVLALVYAGQTDGVIAAIPTLGALALGAQRLLPLAQAVNVAYVQYAGSVGTVEDLLHLLDAPILPPPRRLPDAMIAPLREGIVFDHVSFGYRGDSAEAGRETDPRLALDDVSLAIGRGMRVGIVGQTGSGKSTLLDILAGLLAPTNGVVLIDGEPLGDATIENWQAQVAHVPQTIFLLDDTIAANIAFGLPQARIDMDRVRDAARRAHIEDVVVALPDGFDTRIGERGVRLSGGQRQRLGIARALYKSATVLILDEATSALDDATEKAVMQGIEQLDRDLTIVMIAHRLTTVAMCDTVVRLEQGRIVAQGSYADVILAPSGYTPGTRHG